MNEDHSFKAVFQPGETEGYFDVHGNKPFPVSSLVLNPTVYNPLAAWYLAELCRLVYRQGGDEGGGRLPTRAQILNDVGMEEVAFINESGSSAMIVAPSEGVRIVAFRGTNDFTDWLSNINVLGVQAHLGFQIALQRVWAGVQKHLLQADLVIWTGHSLGAAMAVLAAARQPGPLYTIGAPRASRGLKLATSFRIVNHLDSVPALPLPYEHVGALHYLNRKGEGKLKPGQLSVWRDQLQGCTKWKKTDAPEPLSDHAPVNYVARLQRLV